MDFIKPKLVLKIIDSAELLVQIKNDKSEKQELKIRKLKRKLRRLRRRCGPNTTLTEFKASNIPKIE